MAQRGPGGRRLAVLDANALLSAMRLKIDLEEELKEAAPGFVPVVLSCVSEELEDLGHTRGASGARALATRFGRAESKGRGDRAILDFAASHPGCAVVTNDRRLRAQLRAVGVPVLFIRGRSKLELDGAL